jgi:hypothetical protein
LTALATAADINTPAALGLWTRESAQLINYNNSIDRASLKAPSPNLAIVVRTGRTRSYTQISAALIPAAIAVV